MSPTVNEVSEPTRDPTLDVATQLLCDNLAALPSKEYGVVNVLPFAREDDHTRAMRRLVSEAIVELLEANDMLKHDVPQAEPPVGHQVIVKCLACENDLVVMPTSAEGVSRVDGSRFVGLVASLNSECPHKVRTMEDLRRHLEQEFLAAEAEDEALSDEAAQTKADQDEAAQIERELDGR